MLGYPDGEHRAHSGCGFDIDCPAHDIDKPMGNGQPESAAFVGSADSIGFLLECREEIRHERFRDAYTGIGNGNQNVVIGFRNRNGYRTPFCVLDGVIHDCRNRFMQELRIEGCNYRIGWEDRIDCQSLMSGK
jgi:hypothetical protein